LKSTNDAADEATILVVLNISNNTAGGIATMRNIREKRSAFLAFP
jgi:hypothetical protein